MRALESVIVVAVLLAIPARLGAADAAMANLQPRTTGAYEAYVASAEVAFLTRVRSGEPVAQAAGASTVGQTTDGRIVKVPEFMLTHMLRREVDQMIERLQAEIAAAVAVPPARTAHACDADFIKPNFSIR